MDYDYLVEPDECPLCFDTGIMRKGGSFGGAVIEQECPSCKYKDLENNDAD